jgi:Transglycosylase-like domain
VRKLLPLTMFAWTLGVAALAPAKEPERTHEKILLSSLSEHPLRSNDARPAKRAAKRAIQRDEQRADPVRAASAISPQLEAIAACESGGDPGAVSANGAYRGKYQFSPATWQAVGGQGDPATAPEVEQDRRAAMLMERSGPAQWPVCGS